MVDENGGSRAPRYIVTVSKRSVVQKCCKRRGSVPRLRARRGEGTAFEPRLNRVSWKRNGLMISDSQSISWIRKTFSFLAMLALLLLCSGCFCSMVVYHCDENCYDEIRILERRIDFSQDGKSLSVYLKKQTTSRRDPFHDPIRYHNHSNPVGKWQKVSVDEATHTYPLTSPEANAVLKEFLVISDAKVRTCRGFVKNVFGGSDATMSSDRALLPILFIDSIIDSKRKPGAVGIGSCTLHIHPDDFKYLSRPFVLGSYTQADRVNGWEYSFMIPYKLEGDRCYAYSPKEDLICKHLNWWRKRPNASRTVWKVVLLPPAFVLDVATSPLQLVLYYFIFRPLEKLCHAPRESIEKMYS